MKRIRSEAGFSLVAGLIVLAVFALIGVVGWKVYDHQNQSSKNANSVKVRLIDAYSTKIIAHTSVKITSSNGIECITAPCPTDNKEWKGTTDNEGFVTIPGDVFNTVNTVSATGYELMAVDVAKGQDDNGFRTIELDPDSLISTGMRKFKLIGSVTKRPLSGVIARIVKNNASSCTSSQCEGFIIESKTNSLGNIYYPQDKLIGFDKAYVYVNGYRTTEAHFDTNYRNVELEQE